MIPDNINAALADKPEVLEFVKGLDAKADKLTPDLEELIPKVAELKGILPKLPELQQHSAGLLKLLTETKAKDAETLLKDFNAIKAVKMDLERQRDEWKKTSGGAGDVTQTPEYKALEEKLTNALGEFKVKVDALETESKASKDATALAQTQKRDTDLKASVVTAGAKHKIRDPEDEYLLLQAKGLIGHKEVEGKQVAFYYKLNEKGEKVDAGSADGLMKWIAETNKAKVDPSGKGGSGQEHKGTGGGGDDLPKTASDARRAFMTR